MGECGARLLSENRNTDFSKRNFDQIEGKNITEKVAEHWNRLPRGIVLFPVWTHSKLNWTGL